MPLFLFTACGDLEPDMQDTRTVILNMDFHERSSSRSSSSVSASELSQYNTHLILALPSWEYLTSNYSNFYSSFAQGLMNTADKKVSLEIPLNTQMKIFAFLFKENYSMSELFSGVREVGYYGKSESFSIDTQTNKLSLGITLESTTDTNTDGGSTDTTPPVIAEVTPITTPTSNSTPDYTFSSTEAGTITYGGSCSSSITTAISGNNTITMATLSNGTYSDCTITVTDSAGNTSNTLTITSFTVQTISTLPAPDNFSASGANNTITLTWNTVSGATSYTLYWDNVSGIDNSDTPITTITNNYTHSNIDNGSIYYYKVAAVNSSGTGALSHVASALLSSYVKDSASLSGHTFAITSAAMNWNNAKVLAIALGGYITTVNSKAENNWLTTRFRIQYGTELWIGANDKSAEGSWVWDNGTTDYDNGLTDNLSNNAKWGDNITRKWYINEPNNSGNCAHIWKTSGHWDDTNCNSNRYAIIEFN